VRVEVQRAVDRLVGVPLCALLSAWDAVRGRLRGGAARDAGSVGDAPAARAPRRILVVLLSEMGSLVLAYPMFTRLRERYPGCELYALMFAKNREVLDLLEVMPREHVVTLRDRSLSQLLADSVSALRRLRALELDVVIDCELFARISALFARLSGAALRVGFHRHTQEGLYRGSFMNRPVPYNPYRHIGDQFLALADAIGSAAHPRSKLGAALPWPRPARAYDLPALRLAPGELEASRERLATQHPATTGRRLVLVYAGGGILPIRAWPEASYVALCRALLERGHAVGLIGLADDRPLATRIRDTLGHPQCVDLTGYTRNIRELVVLFHHADLLVSNDGGPGQFAAMTPIASIVLFGPETPALYGSLSPRAVSMHRADMPCSPCLTAYNHRNSFCDGDNQCLKRIEPATVLERALALLETAPAPPAVSVA
jgi:ADP-heptose:LPS heptosyltransferase